MQDAGTTVFICTSCRSTSYPGQSPGCALIDALRARLSDHAGSTLSVAAVECLSVCNRPSTVAFAGSGKWTYVIGDLDPSEHVDDVLSMALKYAASDNGIVPWRERPVVVRKGVIARVPPLPDLPGS